MPDTGYEEGFGIPRIEKLPVPVGKLLPLNRVEGGSYMFLEIPEP